MIAIRRILLATHCCMNPSLSIPAAGLPSSLLRCQRIIPATSKHIHVASTHPACGFKRLYRINNPPFTHHQISSACQWPLVAAATRCHSTSASSTRGTAKTPGEEPGWLKRQWVKFITTIRAFATGTKALYKDVVKMREIQSRHLGKRVDLGCPPVDPKTGLVEFPMSREELFFVVKTRKDLWKMLPTVILFFIPFLGYFVPLIAFMYPHRFLSPHFLTDQHKAELMASAHLKSLAKVKDLAEELKQREDDKQLVALLYKASAMFSCGQFFDEVIDQRLSTWSLKNVNKAKMECVLAVWGMKSWLPSLVVRRRREKLTRHMGYIYTSDWLMKLEGGVDSLSHEALSEVCCERRLDVDLNSTEDMREKLDIWMKITTAFEECPEVMLAHLPAAQYLQHTRTRKH